MHYYEWYRFENIDISGSASENQSGEVEVEIHSNEGSSEYYSGELLIIEEIQDTYMVIKSSLSNIDEEKIYLKKNSY